MRVFLTHHQIENFKRSFPCSGIPELASITFEFDSRENLCGIVAVSFENVGTIVDSSEFDGAGLLALSHEAQEYGKRSDYYHAPIVPTEAYVATLRDKLGAAIEAYDTKQMAKRGYSIYALAQMLRRLNEVCDDIQRGADVRSAITAGFCGRALDVVLKAAGLPKSLPSEQRGGLGGYRPVTPEPAEVTK